jgi:hypothetical protein
MEQAKKIKGCKLLFHALALTRETKIEAVFEQLQLHSP